MAKMLRDSKSHELKFLVLFLHSLQREASNAWYQWTYNWHAFTNLLYNVPVEILNGKHFGVYMMLSSKEVIFLIIQRILSWETDENFCYRCSIIQEQKIFFKKSWVLFSGYTTLISSIFIPIGNQNICLHNLPSS